MLVYLQTVGFCNNALGTNVNWKRLTILEWVPRLTWPPGPRGVGGAPSGQWRKLTTYRNKTNTVTRRTMLNQCRCLLFNDVLGRVEKPSDLIEQHESMLGFNGGQATNIGEHPRPAFTD